MNGCTINIADFRCRASKRADRQMPRSVSPSVGLSLVETKAEVRPAVYDISEAREAQRMRTRLTFRPLGIQRRSNVLRFRTNEPIRMAVRVAEQPREKFRGATDGQFDLPPAA